MKKFDLAAISVILAAGLALLGVILVGRNLPIDVVCQHPAGCAQVGPFGALEFEFSRPVQSGLVESLWRSEPVMEGRWEWSDDRHASWHFTDPLLTGQTVALWFEPGPAGANGESIGRGFRWEVSLRPLQVVAIRDTSEGMEMFAFDLDGASESRQITRTGGNVYDYSVSPDGERIAVAVINETNGMDLWLINRDGTGREELLDCGKDRCSTPVWSPDMREIVYTRQNAGLVPDGPVGAPRTYLIEMAGGQSVPLFEDSQVLGYGASWSPDGRWLSIWNGAKGGIQVVNRETTEGFLLETQSGDTGSWTADSRSLYFSDAIIGETSYRNVVLKADIDSRVITTVLGGNAAGQGASVEGPIVNPVYGDIAVISQTNVKLPGRKLQVLDPETKQGVQIVSNLSYLPGFYSWTPDGGWLLYQLDYLQGQTSEVEIWYWDRAAGASELISTGSRWPQWLP